jgi:small-conductance mechanosensitive channel
VSSASDNASVSVRLQNVTKELRQIQDLLTSEKNVDPRILTDFRDAVNRVRNTAWAVEQYANSKTTETDPKTVLSVLAGERLRVTYQLCKLVQADLANVDIQFQKGQLLQLRDAMQELTRRLGATVGE